MAITFRPLREEDLPLLQRWLSAPHVDAWWHQPLDLAGVSAKYLPRIDGREPTHVYLIESGGRPIGWMEWYRWSDYPAHAARLGAGSDTAGIDLAIGEADELGSGLGPRAIQEFLANVVFADPAIAACVCDPEERNLRSLRAFEKAGFTVVRTVRLSENEAPRRVVRRDRSSASTLDDGLRRELLAMREEDGAVRSELDAAGALGGAYVPRMEAVHRKNAARLRAIIDERGWPFEDVAGVDGAEAAWLVAQHAVGEPDLQRRALALIRGGVADGRLAAWHAAFLEDRIAMHEGRPQRYGTQWVDDAMDGRWRPWTLADPAAVAELRASVGLKPLAPIPERGPELPPDERAAIEANHRWWRDWLDGRGWR